MRHKALPPELFSGHRAKLYEHLKPGSIVVLNANDIMPTNADGTMPFVQQTDLFHLSGINQEETILVLFPDFPEEGLREVLFLRETNEEIAIWEGHKYTKEEARHASGIQNVKWLGEFDRVFHQLMTQAQHVYLNTNDHLRAKVEVETRDSRFIKYCKDVYPLHEYERLNPLMHQLRAVKDDAEVDMLATACNITKHGFERVLGFVKPGVKEYEIEAEYLHEFVRRGSTGFAYTPIIASGANACVLHYIDNDQVCQEGDVLLMDVGAKYGPYNADMTRSIPVSGRFTDRQKAVYNAVLRVQREAMKLLQPGTTIQDYHKEVGKIMTHELIGLGLIDQTDVKNAPKGMPAYKKYFMHGTSHHLGLDVHDYGNWYAPMQVGNVFTVEPGIYILEEGLGIRLENDVVITNNGINDLMGHIPIEVEAIEDLMNR